MTNRSALLDLIKKRAIIHKEVTLASGQKSSYYIDARSLFLHGESATLIGEALYDLTKDLPMAAIGGGGAAGRLNNGDGRIYLLGFEADNQGGITLPEKCAGAGNARGSKILFNQGVADSVGIAVADNGNNQFEHS